MKISKFLSVIKLFYLCTYHFSIEEKPSFNHQIHKNMESFVRGIQRVGLILKNGSKVTNSTARKYASTVTKCKMIEGNNGEQIFSSCYEDVEIPSLTIPEYLWQKLEKWPKRIAVVRIQVLVLVYLLILLKITKRTCSLTSFSFRNAE